MANLRTATRLRSGSMSSSVQDIGASLARQAEIAGERLQSLARTFRDALPRDGAATLVSEGIETARGYFGERDLRELGRDALDLARRYPVQTIVIGAGVGWLVGRFASGRMRFAPEGQGVKDVMTRHVEVIGPDATVKDVAAKMADLDVGVMPVCDGDRLLGMVTDRDIAIRAIARGLPPSTPLREIMSTTVRYAFEDEPVERVRETMRKHGIRRLPVLDANKHLVGIVSLGDLAVEADTEAAGDVLQRVSAARPTH